jgi:hypothetical protein
MSVILVVLGLIVVFIIAVILQPSEFRVARTAVMEAPVTAVFVQVNDLRNWHAWSPWAKLDPAAKEIIEGTSEGVGAVLRWDGNNKVGAGSMTITESRPNETVEFRLDFIRPFAGTSTADFTFKPEGARTSVTWSMFGHNDFKGKAMGLILNCEKMLGGQFEKGLASMKSIVEKK